jgi:iron(III) transport system ATP-binding protein
VTMEHAPAVELRGLTKRYGKADALADVDLDLAPGSFTVLLGPSGSGKSTLLRCVAGIERVSTGTIAFDGRTVAGPRAHVPAEERGLAMVFQDYALWPHLSVVDNVRFALRRLRLGRAEAVVRAEAMLARVGLGGFGPRYPTELSGGEQQRVALARALVAGPGLLLFDEPLSNLDADLRERLRVEIATLTRETGATALYITHDQSEAFALADRIGVLDRGRLVQVGTAEDLYRDPATPFVARFTGLAGELPGIVDRVAADRGCTIRVDDLAVGARPGTGTSLTGGQRVRVLVRSASATIEEGGERLAWAPAESAERPMAISPAVVPATVRDVAFRGRGYDHVVEVGGGHRLTGIFHTRRIERGQRVALRVDPAGCIAFPDGAPALDGAAADAGAGEPGTRPEATDEQLEDRPLVVARRA